MTIRLTEFGGTDWADAEVLFAADQNATIKATITHRALFSDSTLRSTTSNVFVDSGTAFTLLAPVGALMTSLTVRCEITNQAEIQSVTVAIKIDGTNLGSIFPNSAPTGTTTIPAFFYQTSEAGIFTHLTSNINEGVFVEKRLTMAEPIKILDASTSIIMRLLASGTGAAEMKNVTVDVTYVENFSED